MFSIIQPSNPAQAHLWLTYGWLGVCGLAPVVVVLIIWAICMHYTYRPKWRTLDVLLGAALVQELPNALVILVIGAIKGALIHLPRDLHTRNMVSYLLVWATTSTRFYQFAVVTSLLADRALILKWPYRYRFAIRHTQIKVFLVILAVISSLVGAGGIYSHYQLVQLSHLGNNSTREIVSRTSVSFSMPNRNHTWPINSSQTESGQYQFTYDPLTFDRHYHYLFVVIYVFFTLISVVCFLYVECNRPRSSATSGKNRYLPSIATLFTTATTSSTATSSSTSSSLSASSPLPSRFSSLANLTTVPAISNHSNQKSPGHELPSFYYPNMKRDSKDQTPGTVCAGRDTLNSLYPISIVDMIGHENVIVGSSTYASMSTTDNSIYRLIEPPNSNSRSNSLNLVNESKHSEHQSSNQHRSNSQFAQSDPSSSLDPLNPNSRVNSFSKPHLYSASSQLKLNTAGSSDSFSGHRSAFDLRWSSVLGPVTFCLAFNHGPYLVFTLLGIFMPGVWTPFHDLILAGLTLFEALFLPLILFLSDSAFRGAIKKSCHCQSDKISSKSHHPSLAFSDRNLLTPPYLHSAPNKQASNHLSLSNYQSDLDLSKQDQSTSKVRHPNLCKPMPSHATSMLDLSCRTPYHQQAASRSRHSLALLQHLPTNSLTPRSSFRRRPPSVASYHYLYSNNQSQSKSKYPQYLFGAVPSKSESTLNVLHSPNFNGPSLISNHLKQIKENEVDTEPKLTMGQLGSNHHLDNVPSNNELSRPFLSRQTSEPTDKQNKSGPKLKELINGLAARSSFKRRSVRKCGSDASTFYTRRNLKRSQIAQNQLSSILYNNFYTKKLVPAFGSQITLLEDKEAKEGKDLIGAGSSPFHLNHLQARHLSYDFSQQSPMSNSHVYLPNTSHLEVNNRSNSCNQLSVLNGDYHNHLLVKQNFALHNAEVIANQSSRDKGPLPTSRDYGHQNAIIEDEHIYASLPEEEEEDDETRQSGSFSARSTLPDNCQLISYSGREGNFGEGDNATKKEIDFQMFAFQVKTNRQHYGSNDASTSSSSSDQSSTEMCDNNGTSSSSSTVEESEDIYEEVSHLIGSSSGSSELNRANKNLSASQDTLTGDIGQSENCDPNMDGVQISDDDEDDDDIDEDRISMLSETSSSTFSSFTTCANQDFEFIVSQNMTPNVTSPNSGHERQVDFEAQERILKRSAKAKGGSVGKSCNKLSNNQTQHVIVGDEVKAEEIEPSTLSMAAIYYNRFILNQSGQAKMGLRQRPKINRRQSFSTAYELRQRILVNQLNLQRERLDDETRMSLIEEENELSSINLVLGNDSPNHEYRGLTDGLDDLFPYKLSRRISTSEDNLLSIISTIANCGDDNHEQECLTEAKQSPVRCDNRTNAQHKEHSSKSNTSSESYKNDTFLKDQPGKHFIKKVLPTKQANSAIPRATNLNRPNEVSPSRTMGQGTNYTANISIKELKSKKKATKQPDGNKSRPKSTLNADRICELGSLWDRPQSGSAKAKNFGAQSPKAKSLGKMVTNGKSFTSSPSSSPSSPSRVPTFIPASVGSPRRDLGSRTTANFISKLSPPSQYTVKAKQNARQNAILAKNALMLSNVETNKTE